MIEQKLAFIKVDFNNVSHGESLLYMMDHYARHPMGGGRALPEKVVQNLLSELRKREYAHAFLAYVGESPAGLAICMEGFSTFSCLPLINIHDLVIHEDYRHRGVVRHLLQFVEDYARSCGSCKITLEVLEGNIAAQKAYQKFGFKGYSLGDEYGNALFWEKKLSD